MNFSMIVIAVTALAYGLSYAKDKDKTRMAFMKGRKMFLGIAPIIVNILIVVSVVLYLLPREAIATYLGADSGVFGVLIAAIAGSVTMMPPIVSYPLAAFLIERGGAYTVVVTFMTTLTMVGVMTMPLEMKYFGKKAAVARNVVNFIAAIVIGLVMGALL